MKMMATGNAADRPHFRSGRLRFRAASIRRKNDTLRHTYYEIIINRIVVIQSRGKSQKAAAAKSLAKGAESDKIDVSTKGSTEKDETFVPV